MRKWEFCFAMPPVKQTFLHVPLERFKDTSGATYSKVLNSFCHEAFSSPKFQQLYQQCLTLVVSGRAWAHLFSGNWKDILLECRRIRQYIYLCTNSIRSKHEICTGEDATKQSFFRKSGVQISSQRLARLRFYLEIFFLFRHVTKYSN